MSICQVQVHKLAIWSSPSGYHVPVEANEIFNSILKVFSIADDILIGDFTKHGKDHDENIRQGTQEIQAGKSEASKRCVFSDAPAFHSLAK